jgi:hypothetical protein
MAKLSFMSKRYGGLTGWEILLVVFMEAIGAAIFIYGYCNNHHIK